MASQEERDRIMAEFMAQVQDEDDEDDEGEFDPNVGDESDEEDEDSGGVSLKGSLSMNEEGRLVYSGTWTSSGENQQQRKFKLKSKPQKLPLHWDETRPTVSEKASEDTPRMRTIVFDGFFVAVEGHKIKERDVQVTFTANPQSAIKASAPNGHNLKSLYKDYDEDEDDDDDYDDEAEEGGKIAAKPAAAKTDNEEDGKGPSKPAAATKSDDVDAENGKQPSKPAAQDQVDGEMPSKSDNEDAKMPSSPYETTANGGNNVIYGVFGRGTNEYGNFEFQGTLNGGKELICEKRYVQSGGAAAGGATAAAADSDAEDGGADDEVDYNELIALHQDARLSVDDLRKRYHGDNDDEPRSSKSKRARGEEQVEQESDDDEEYGF